MMINRMAIGAIRRPQKGGSPWVWRQSSPSPALSPRLCSFSSNTAAAAGGEKDGVGGGRFLFVGAPGVGKGTFASIIAPQMGLRVVTAGDLIRSALQEGEEEHLRQMVREGGLLPDDVVLGLVMQHVTTTNSSSKTNSSSSSLSRSSSGGGGGHDGTDEKTHSGGFILDGFPRTVPQARALDAALLQQQQQQGGLSLDGVLSIELEEWVAVRKLLGRTACTRCGRSFNSAHIVTTGYDMPAIPPPAPGQCAVGGSECPVWREGGGLVRREDDRDEAVVRRRMQVFRDSTAPLLQHYDKQGLLVRFVVRKGVKDAPALMQAMVEQREHRRRQRQQQQRQQQ